MKKTGELGLKGKGVEAISIPELDDALSVYEKAKNKRVKASQEEIPAKDAVLTLMHANEKKLRQPDGTLSYSYSDSKIVTVSATKEKIKIKDIAEEEEGD